MKYIITLSITLISFCTVFSQQLQYWDVDSTITWSDFQGQAGKDEYHVECGIELFFEDSKEIKWHIRTFFDKQQSWVNEESKKSTLSLSVAICHFEITEIYRRRLEVQFDKLDKKENANIREYWKCYKRNGRELGRTIKKFHREVQSEDTSNSYVNWREWIITELWHK